MSYRQIVLTKSFQDVSVFDFLDGVLICEGCDSEILESENVFSVTCMPQSLNQDCPHQHITHDNADCLKRLLDMEKWDDRVELEEEYRVTIKTMADKWRQDNEQG